MRNNISPEMTYNRREFGDAVASGHAGLTDDEVYEMQEAFNLFDTNGTGRFGIRPIDIHRYLHCAFVLNQHIFSVPFAY